MRKKRKPGMSSVRRPDWTRFCTGWHGKGAHSDRSRYTRKRKHKERSNDEG